MTEHCYVIKFSNTRFEMLLVYTARKRRKDCIYDFRREWNRPESNEWRELRRIGYSCVPVEVKEVSQH